ncbi:hypothetical protein Aduo_019123 [Ancylostoma duodenale]
MWWLIAFLPLVSSRNVFVSSPFDNFRIECPKRTAAIELSIRMVESVGAKRQDVVFDMSCEKVDELFPWVNIPTGISEIEREDCYYSSMFDPILDEATAYSCNRREYVAGITRLTDTRVQVMCCRLRSRDESNCHETLFNKPIGLSKSTIVEYENQLINAIRVDGERYVVRFCDMSPRDIGSIYTDVKTTTTPQYRTTKRPTTIRPYNKKVEKLPPTLFTLEPSTVLPLPTAPSTARSTPPPTSATTTTSAPPPPAIPSFTKSSEPHGSINANALPDYTEENSETVAPKISGADIVVSSLPTEPSITETPSANKEDGTTSATSHISTVEYQDADQFDGEHVQVVEQCSEEMLMEESSTNHARPASPTIFEDSKRNLEASLPPVAEQPWQEDPQSVVNEDKLMEMDSNEEADYNESATNSQPVAIASTMQSPTSEVSNTAKTKPVQAATGEQFTEKPVEKPEGDADMNANNKARADSLEDITMVSDLSRLTFHNDEFPKSNEKKLATSTRLKISKTELPLKAGVSADDFLFLRPINSEGHRRSPIRTYRPHVVSIHLLNE